METKQKRWNGRRIETEMTFKRVEGTTFGAMYEAKGWLHGHGYTYGSTDRKPNLVAIQKGAYNLPQKWHNFTKEDKQKADGVMIAGDWREGAVRVVVFEDKKNIIMHNLKSVSVNIATFDHNTSSVIPMKVDAHLIGYTIYGFYFFIVKDIVFGHKEWTISEYSTGFRFVSSSTKKGALEELKTRAEKVGENAFRKGIEKTIKKCGILNKLP